MRPVPRVLAGIAATSGALLGPMAAPVLAAGGGTATAPLLAEAWYRSSPACSLMGCVGPAPSPYAAETLHVGVQVGTEEARTYLQLDLSVLPAGTTLAGGRLVLPVASGPQDGSANAAAAELRACLVRVPVVEVDGGFDAPPAADCGSVSVPAVHAAAAGGRPAEFTVDLGPFAPAWRQPGAPAALALLPAEGPAPTDTWHVAFSGRDRAGAGVAPIAATVSYAGTGGAGPTQAPEPVATGLPEAPVGGTAPPTVQVPVTTPAPSPAPAPVVRPPARSALPVAAQLPPGFKYPGVFLLPILLVAAAGWAARALTRDLAAGTPATLGGR